MLGALLGNYRIVEQLGEGGMGVVYIGRHEQLGRRVVVKVLRPEMSRNADMAKRLFNEAQAATAIRNPGIAQVFDYGETSDGRVYFVMELLEGESLTARLAQRRLDYVECCRIGRQIANVLQAAHEAGITHRDLKPDNLFLVPDPEVIGGERVKVLDFGIAKLAGEYHAPGVQTRTGLVMGTPNYMAPEQCRGAVNADARSDIYALGCLLFKMTCGRPPFVGAGLGDIVGAHLHVPPPEPRSFAPDLPPAFAQLILHMLAKPPDERPQTMSAVSQALDEILRSLGGPSARLPPPAPVQAPPPALPGLPPRAPGARPPLQPPVPPSGPQHARAASASPVPPSGPQHARAVSPVPVPSSGPRVRPPTPVPVPPARPSAMTRGSPGHPPGPQPAPSSTLTEDLETASFSPISSRTLDTTPRAAGTTPPEDRATVPYPLSSSTGLTDLETTPFVQQPPAQGDPDTTIVDDSRTADVNDGDTTNVEELGRMPPPVPPPAAPHARAPSPPPVPPSAPYAAPSAPYPHAGAPLRVPQLPPMAQTIQAPVHVSRPPARRFAWQRFLVIGGIVLAAVVTALVIALASGDPPPPRPPPTEDRLAAPPEPAEPADAEIADAAAVPPSPPVTSDAAAQASAPGQADDLEARCRKLEEARGWTELEQCARELEPLSPQRAAELRNRAVKETETAARITAFEAALRARNLRRAELELNKVWPDSVSHPELKGKYEAAETQAIAELAADLESVKDSGCEEYQALLAKAKTSQPSRVATEAARRTPCKPQARCDADALAEKGREQHASNQLAAALASFEQAYSCSRKPTLAQKAFVVACNMHSLSKARLHWKQLSPALRTQAIGTCVRNGITEAQLNAP